METGILVAIIGGGTTVLAAIVTGVFVLLKKRGEEIQVLSQSQTIKKLKSLTLQLVA